MTDKWENWPEEYDKWIDWAAIFQPNQKHIKSPFYIHGMWLKYGPYVQPEIVCPAEWIKK